jgi:hypothetical protein
MNNTGASFNKKGELVKANTFSDRKIFECDEQTLSKIKELEIVDSKDLKDIDDPSIYNWYQIGNSKYGRFMYCPITNTKRTQTMGEFYGNGIVD